MIGPLDLQRVTDIARALSAISLSVAVICMLYAGPRSYLDWASVALLAAWATIAAFVYVNDLTPDATLRLRGLAFCWTLIATTNLVFIHATVRDWLGPSWRKRHRRE